MKLTQDQMEEYRRKGYVLVPGLLSSEEVDVLEDALRDLNTHDGPEVAREKSGKPHVIFLDADREVVINGQSSAWVSYAPLAQTSLAYLPCDYGDGLVHENGRGRRRVHRQKPHGRDSIGTYHLRLSSACPPSSTSLTLLDCPC